MIHRPPVCAPAILRAITRVRRQGADRVLEELERQEPDLAEYLMEELTGIYHGLLELGGPAKKTRAVQRQMTQLALVCIEALRAPLPVLPSRPHRRRQKAGGER